MVVSIKLRSKLVGKDLLSVGILNFKRGLIKLTLGRISVGLESIFHFLNPMIIIKMILDLDPQGVFMPSLGDGLFA